MKSILYIIAGIILLSIGPQLILGLVFTVGIYYFLYTMLKGITSGSSGRSAGSHSDDSDSRNHWHGTGNPYV